MGNETWTWAGTWWSLVVMIGVINLGIGIYLFIKSRNTIDDDNKVYLKRMRIAGIVFLSVAMYRAVFVSRYLTQLAWFDTILNSSLLIRFIAMFAEVAFAYLISRALIQVNKDIFTTPLTSKVKEFFRTKSPHIFFYALVIAQPFAYGGTINKIRVLFAIEETLWGIAFMVVIPLIIMQLKAVLEVSDENRKKELSLIKYFLIVIAVFCIGYGSYSVFYHLPIEYWPAALEQLRMETPVPTLRYGFDAIKDAFLIVNKNHNYNDWGGMGFVIWHTGYFTLCGWMVLLFMTAPRKLKIANKQ